MGGLGLRLWGGKTKLKKLVLFLLMMNPWISSRYVPGDSNGSVIQRAMHPREEGGCASGFLMLGCSLDVLKNLPFDWEKNVQKALHYHSPVVYL